MAAASGSPTLRHGVSLWCPQSPALRRATAIPGPHMVPSYGRFRRGFSVAAASGFANENREYVIVGGGNAAGYAARTFVEHGMADGRLCIVSKEAVAPYERPALTKGYLFPLDKKPARLPGFHTCVGTGGERQTPEWYKEHGIEVLYGDPVTSLDIQTNTLKTSSGKHLKYGSLIIATGCTAVRFPEGKGGSLPGVHYIRDVADADSLVSSLEKAHKVVVIGGGYIGMEVVAAIVRRSASDRTDSPESVRIRENPMRPIPMRFARFPSDSHANRSDTPVSERIRRKPIPDPLPIRRTMVAACVGWNLDATIIFPENHVMPRLFTPSIAQKYEGLYQENGVKFLKGALIDKLEAGSDGRVAAVRLKGGSVIEADTVIVGIGAKPVVSPFEAVGLNDSVGGIQVDGQFRTSVPGIFAIGDVAAFPLRIYDRMARVEHVDHARKSANHCARTLLSAQSHLYDYLPFFYSRVFEYEGSSRKVWWQFYGDNVGDTIEIGNFDPKMAAFWLDSDGRLKGVFLESGSAEEFAVLPRLAREQPFVDRAKLQSASSVESALELAKNSLQIESKV